MKTKQVVRHCSGCGEATIQLKEEPNEVVGCLLTIVTFGLFLPIWIFSIVVQEAAATTCTACGKKNGGLFESLGRSKHGGKLLLIALATVSVVILVTVITESIVPTTSEPGLDAGESSLTTEADTGAASEPSSRFRGTTGNIWPGWPLHLRRDTAVYIGRVVGVVDDRLFEDGTIRDAVLIEFPDGSRDFIPRAAVHLLYVTANPSGRR